MDFRNVIRKNNIRTRLVVMSYIFLMLIIGLLADVATHPNEQLDLVDNAMMFVTFHELPIATFIVLGLTFLGLVYIHFRGHKMMLAGMNAREITQENANSPQEKQLFNIIEELSLSASLGYIPRLYILETDEPNAFAAGWNNRNALVGVTRGLLQTLNRQEVQAVLAHEVGHIIHGDSKLTLYVGILANVILTVTNLFSQIFIRTAGRSRNNAANKAQMILLVLNFVLPWITQILYFYLSRTREYMADAAAVDLTSDNQAMISALKKISGNHETHEYDNSTTGQAYRKAAYIFNKGDSVFSTHPSIENRIAVLEGKKQF
ncbi:zinc metalloprotease HtpX [Providencia huaxiensis]|uniref:Zinc metalloprotease HtpX n=1 Tax=Providencia huaxiensis TaxID=2027290 RepID=A0A345LW11_9GAMM|nr:MULTISPECIES: zinc metalloprotease HtpX [Providencia]AXH62301.1 zinc metalloprotease HtpX [Providencia huaxiensis]MBN6361978.1 zinc metalloprotease HtpX [Providencia huaxiensis]MBQ0268423.1 zinc metalloprotease HtpX [Providencia huaxiensis]MBQ0533178.1 zinc metalloprotease HtpX [Providencia huaxiensis]MBQ0588380.1 zinc metalloprotease HtpX [Providencia huaxiensis]